MNRYFSTIHRIICLGHWITDRVGQELKEYNITEPQYNVLRTLKEAYPGPLTMQDVLKAMVQRNSNVTRIVDKLLLKKLLSREVCAENRRKMDISITSSGLSLLKKLDKKVQQFHDPIVNMLTQGELKQLNKLLKKLNRKINE